MICPILSNCVPAQAVFLDCQKEKCQWWTTNIDNEQVCVVVDIGDSLLNLYKLERKGKEGHDE